MRPIRRTFLRATSLLRPVWVDVGGLLRPESDPLVRSEAQRWSLVLLARRVPHRLRRVPGGWSLQALEWHADDAAREIGLYLRENPGDDEAVLPDAPTEIRLTALFLFLLTGFHMLAVRPMPSLGLYPHHWLDRGSANAAAILDGEWWRLLTSLTLHADGAHLLGNVLVGGAFAVILAGEMGSGLAWLAILASGAAGNLLNSWALGAPHDAIGFSTAVFGAAGLLAAFRTTADGGRMGLRRELLPVTAGLGLLAMLGSGGENTDLGAHLFGFCSGLLLGVPSGLWLGRRPAPPVLAQAASGAVCVVAVVGAWVRAFA